MVFLLLKTLSHRHAADVITDINGLAFITENNENEHLIFREFHLAKRTHPNNEQQNKIT